MNDVRVVAAGDAALVAEFDDRIDVSVNRRAIAVAQALRHASLVGVRDIVPAYRTVTVYFDPDMVFGVLGHGVLSVKKAGRSVAR